MTSQTALTELVTMMTTTYELSEANYTSGSNCSGVNATACKPRPYNDITRFYPMFILFIVISIICLIIIFAVYTTINEFRNLHGKILLSLSGCLIVTYVFLILDFLLRKKVSLNACIGIGFVIHITFLATFFWTNIMAYDVWRTISRMKPKSEISKRKKYFFYALYAWTATLLTSLPAIVFQNTELIPRMYRPNMGIRRCWLSGTRAFVIYFNSPVGVILFANLIFFLMTTKVLVQIKSATAILNVKKDKQRFKLYLKLFLVMGLIWITEFLPWASGVYKLYILAGILNCFHGLYLFLIFICKRKVFKLIREHFAKRKQNDTSNGRKISQPTMDTSIKSSNSYNLKAASLKVYTVSHSDRFNSVSGE